jgi:hypothetical protein
MKQILLLAPILILMSCTPTKTVEPQTTSGNINVYAPYMWAANAFPRTMKISNSFSNDEVTEIQDMGAQWETKLNNKNFFADTWERTPEVSSPSMQLDNLGKDGVLGIYKIANWPQDEDSGNYLSGGALAVTQIFGRRFNIGASNEYVRIEHADILLNDDFYPFRLNAGPGYDLRTVVLHEMGHFLGLNHNISDTSSVMYPSVDSGSEKRVPKPVDINELASRYNITLPSSGASSQAAMNKPVYKPAANDPGQEIKIMIELRADGNCVHKENGVEFHRHTLLK